MDDEKKKRVNDIMDNGLAPAAILQPIINIF